jgi:hypothetical protein
MKALFVISVDLPNPEATLDVMEYLDPPAIPYFTGDVRVVVGPEVDNTIKFLDEG